MNRLKRLAVAIIVWTAYSAHADSPQASAGQPSSPVIRVNTRLVELSVTVLDKHSRPVIDLKRDDFQVFDDGVLREISFFSGAGLAHPNPASAPVAPQPAGALPARTFSNRTEEDSGSNSVTGVLIDEANTSWEDLAFARGRIIQFLRQIHPRDRIALYTVGSQGFRVLHDFTSDSSDLIERLNSLQHKAPSRPRTEQDDLGDWLHGQDATFKMAQTLPAGRTSGTCGDSAALAGIRYIAQYVSGIPGRKSLIWVSGGFDAPVLYLHDDVHDDVVLIPQNCYQPEMAAVRAANAANLAIYSVDARGLLALKLDTLPDNQEYHGPMVVQEQKGALLTRLGGIEQSEVIMRDVGNRTGGRAFTETNDVLGAIGTAFAEARAAYTLGFYPDSRRLTGGYHRIQVKVAGKRGLIVRCRRGYFDASESVSPDDEIRDAIQSPLDATAIALTGTMVPSGGGYALHLNIGISGVQIQEDGERWRGSVRVITVQKDDRGNQCDYRDDTLRLDLKADTYAAMVKSGLEYDHAITLNPAAASIAVVVRDQSGNLGSVTIPVK